MRYFLGIDSREKIKRGNVNKKEKTLSVTPAIKFNFAKSPVIQPSTDASIKELEPSEVDQAFLNIKLPEEIFVREVDGYLTELSGSPIMYGENYDPKSRIFKVFFFIVNQSYGNIKI